METRQILEIITLVLINAFVIFLIIVVLANSLKDNVYRWFAIMSLFLAFWVDFSYFGYISSNLADAITFYRFNSASVILFFVSAYIFYIESFLNIKNRLLRYSILIFSGIFFVLALFTNNIIQNVATRSWGNEIIFGILNPHFLAYSAIITIIFLYFFISKYYSSPEIEKSKILFFLIGTFLFIAFNLVFNLFTTSIYKTGEYQHLGDYSAIFFLAFTSFAMLRHKFLNVKIAFTAVLISIIGVLIVIDVLFLSHGLLEQGIKAIILLSFIFTSVLLVKSVLTEIRQKEELEKTNKALHKSRQRYFDLATEQKDIIDVMGHEIRTPLTAIIQEMNLHKSLLLPKKESWINGKIAEDERLKITPLIFESFDTIDRATEQAVQLVNDMLETARLDKKRFELNYSEFEIGKELESNVTLMSKTVTPDICRIEFENKIGKEKIVLADKTRVKEAVDALINNAIKYRDTKKSNCFVKIVLSSNAKNFKVDVIDNGIGIARNNISKLGRKFYRLNAKTNDTLKRPGGTGLGLFVVKGIVSYHKGLFSIHSDGIGQGSIFTIEIPIKP